MKHILRKSRGQALLRHHPLMAIDIENNPDTGEFVCGCLYGEYRTSNGCKRFLDGVVFNNKFDMQSFIIKANKHSFILIGFNLGYDHCFLREIIDDSTLFFAKGRFITAYLKNGVKLLCLTNHCKGELKDWMKYLDMGFEKESLDNLEKRVFTDAKATWILGNFLENFYIDVFNTGLKLTIGSQALSIFKKNYYDYFFVREDKETLEALILDAYRGGRVEVYRRGKLKTRRYDFNSFYLSVMKNNYYPEPTSAVYVPDDYEFEEKFNSDLFLIADVDIETPDNLYIPLLPYKDEKLLFPLGRFSGAYTSVELKEALKIGYKIHKVRKYIYWKKKLKIFEKYADAIWSKRQEFKKLGNEGMNIVLKALGNSLYGKFAQRNSIHSYYGKLSEYNGDLPQNSYVRVLDGEEYVSVSSDEKELAEHGFPELSVFAASYARVEMFKKLKEFQDWVVYCDTDSLHLLYEAPIIAESKELGCLDFIGEGEYDYYSPKLYGDRRKGIPKRATTTIDEVKGIIYAVYDKPIKFIEGIRSQKGRWCQWIEREKEMTLYDDKRSWYDDNKLSKPHIIYTW